MGVERAVTRWYILRQPLVDEIAALEVRLAELQQQTSEPQVGTRLIASNDLLDNVKLQLQAAHMRLQALGPCPKSMMG